ncbi:MAG: DUF3369 domain-containing protein [Magnetococcales bacterium]|nr:DUF3369 domain-containing protein [Magnetococcales bacterium]
MRKKIIRSEKKNAPVNPSETPHPWKVLVVDDDVDVLNLTRISLSDFRFDERPLLLSMATSGKQAQEILQTETNFAVAIIDVMMETPDAGLQLVRHIRESLHNHRIRLIIRTGQPGLAPERLVIDTYDIDDYKEKTELTSWKLYTTLRTALKSYRDLMSIEYNRMGLNRILDAAPELYRYRSLEQFLDGILHQMSSVLPSSHHGFLAGTHEEMSAIFASTTEQSTQWIHDNMRVRCGLGRYTDNPVAQSHVLHRCIGLLHAQPDHTQLTIDEQCNVIIPIGSRGHLFGVAYLELNRSLSAEDRQFLEIFAMQCGSALENQQLFDELKNSRDLLKSANRHAIYRLAVASEYKDQETGHHVQRIAYYSRIIAERLSLPEPECEETSVASVLHDLGKISIPDAILHKPGRLNEEELEVMRTHCELGAKILGDAPGLQLAHQIAIQHHEKWDGTGYPLGLRGEEISLPARIVAVADVFDALVSERPYKKPWSNEAAMAEIIRLSGKHFDPAVVDAFRTIYNSGQLQLIQTLSLPRNPSDPILSPLPSYFVTGTLD